jgi:hypothetical protein
MADDEQGRFPNDRSADAPAEDRPLQPTQPGVKRADKGDNDRDVEVRPVDGEAIAHQ